MSDNYNNWNVNDWANLITKYLNLDNNKTENLIHDINNLRANEWLDELTKKLSEEELIAFKKFCNLPINIKMYVSGEGSNDDIDDMANNFYEYYTLSNYMEETDYKEKRIKNRRKSFNVIYEGEIQPSDINDFDNTINNFIKMTHHAEGLYENTNLEYIHVEICIDDKWYGGKEHEIFAA